jgi:hypothetical protein
MGTTPNYSIPFPENTDFVAQGAAAIEAVADGFDSVVYAIANPPFNEQLINGPTEYTILAADAGKIILVGGNTIRTINVQNDAALNFAASTQITILNGIGDPVTVNGNAPAFFLTKPAGDFVADFDIEPQGIVTIIKLPFANNWYATGNIA